MLDWNVFTIEYLNQMIYCNYSSPSPSLHKSTASVVAFHLFSSVYRICGGLLSYLFPSVFGFLGVCRALSGTSLSAKVPFLLST